jgi:tetratricopeptide (TPR) repeat protein
MLLTRLGRYDEACAEQTCGLRILSDLFGKRHMSVARSHVNHAMMLRLANQHDQAAELLATWLPYLREHLSVHTDVAATLNAVANAAVGGAANSEDVSPVKASIEVYMQSVTMWDTVVKQLLKEKKAGPAESAMLCDAPLHAALHGMVTTIRNLRTAYARLAPSQRSETERRQLLIADRIRLQTQLRVVEVVTTLSGSPLWAEPTDERPLEELLLPIDEAALLSGADAAAIVTAAAVAAAAPRAINAAGAAYSHCVRTHGAVHLRTEDAALKLGVLYEVGKGDRQAALSRYLAALAAAKGVLGADDAETAHLVTNIACLHEEAGQYDEACGYFEYALAVFKRALGAEHVQVGLALRSLAHCRLLRAQQWTRVDPDALREANDAVQIQTRSIVRRILALTDAKELLAGLLFRCNDAAAAGMSGELIREALALQREVVWHRLEIVGEELTVAHARKHVSRLQEERELLVEASDLILASSATKHAQIAITTWPTFWRGR